MWVIDSSPRTSGSCLKQGLVQHSAGLERLTPQAGLQGLFTVQQLSLDLGYTAGGRDSHLPPTRHREGPEVRWRGPQVCLMTPSNVLNSSTDSLRAKDDGK